VCACVRLCACMYVSRHLCMYVCIYVRMYVCTYVRTYVFTYVCMCVFMYVCKVRPRTVHKGLEGCRCIALLFNLGAKWGAWSMPRPGRFTPGKYPVPIVEVGSRTGLDGCGKSRPHRDSIPGPSLYRLSYPGPPYVCTYVNICGTLQDTTRVNRP
jgi:hypothetical protein